MSFNFFPFFNRSRVLMLKHGKFRFPEFNVFKRAELRSDGALPIKSLIRPAEIRSAPP